MDYLKNHCWCASSHWDNKHFDCQIIVSMSSYEEESREDWANLIDTVTVFNQSKRDEDIKFYKRCKEKFPDDNWDKQLNNPKLGYVKTKRLKPEVMQWLTDNVADINGEKGWCVGSDAYNISDGTSFSVFMQRRKDAMAFIKRWSKWKKPIYYCQYFTDVRKELNTTTGKYEPR